MECHCYKKGLVPIDCCANPGSESKVYRWAAKVSGLTPDQITDKYLPAVASTIHMGNIEKIVLVADRGQWSVVLQAAPGNCATQIADYLFQTD